jgi:hypothetical protein
MAINSNGYEYFNDDHHPLANKSGQVYTHRVVASLKVGHWLTSDEHVHHIDGNPENNSPENLMVMTQSEHMILEMSGKKKYYEPLFCVYCRKEISRSNKNFICRECFIIHNRKFNPSKEELIEMVSKLPLREIAKIFKVSDKAIKKRCILLGIDTFGYRVKRLK